MIVGDVSMAQVGLNGMKMPGYDIIFDWCKIIYVNTGLFMKMYSFYNMTYEKKSDVKTGVNFQCNSYMQIH